MTRRDREWFRLETAIRLARSMSLMSTCRRLRVGCVVITPKMTEVLAVGYNGPPAGIDNLSCDQSAVGACGCVHAEANAVVKMREVFKPATMVVTVSPCRHCAGIIINSGKIGRVIYDSKYRLTDGIETLAAAGIECLPVSQAVPRVIVVGERENGNPIPGDCPISAHEAWRVGMCRGAFIGSEAKLLSIGIDLSEARSVNLLPPSKDLGDWDPILARAAAASGVEDQPGATWALCGRRVWKAFGGSDEAKYGDAEGSAVLVPHPSGRNRWWNDKKAIPLMRDRLAKVLRLVSR